MNENPLLTEMLPFVPIFSNISQNSTELSAIFPLKILLPQVLPIFQQCPPKMLNLAETVHGNWKNGNFELHHLIQKQTTR